MLIRKLLSILFVCSTVVMIAEQWRTSSGERDAVSLWAYDYSWVILEAKPHPYFAHGLVSAENPKSMRDSSRVRTPLPSASKPGPQKGNPASPRYGE